MAQDEGPELGCFLTKKTQNEQNNSQKTPRCTCKEHWCTALNTPHAAPRVCCSPALHVSQVETKPTRV